VEAFRRLLFSKDVETTAEPEAMTEEREVENRTEQREIMSRQSIDDLRKSLDAKNENSQQSTTGMTFVYSSDEEEREQEQEEEITSAFKHSPESLERLQPIESPLPITKGQLPPLVIPI